MGLPRLERCCFVFELKTGNIIIGCINGVLTFVMLVIMIVEASMLGVLQNQATGLDPEEQAALTGLYVMSIILVLMFLAKFLFDVMFVYGVVTERAGVIKAYFITWTVFFLLSMFIFFLNCPKYSAGTVCTELVYIGLNVYSILLGYSFYKQLNNREEV
ncbi:lysosomal-associated transmembrane protein 4A-like [Manduca sexta]|uniref:Uncharacterized protein n=1 Tax=Manduca sexta TaxID=7130 RepID=A0A922CRN3_MANSE|nr:lysosomal-associated transmembrane protein 4A-like [Manduca sexta]KAG6455917.1 hypothetical protein O3G_MSEX009466 [Manduca sexta]